MGFWAALPTLVKAAVITGGASVVGGAMTNASNRRLAENANRLTQQQFEQQLAFNMSEALKSREFASAEAATARAFNSHEAALYRQWSSKEAAKNRAWMKMMSNTQHQREVKDLRKAGLNPILSAHGGAWAGASPSAAGAAASAMAAQTAMASASSSGGFQAARMNNIAGDAISTGMDVLRGTQEVEESKTRVEKMAHEIVKIHEEYKLTKEATRKLTYEIARLKVQAKRDEAETDLAQARTAGQLSENVKLRKLAEFYKSKAFAAVIKDMGISGSAAAGITHTVQPVYQGAVSKTTDAMEGTSNAVSRVKQAAEKIWDVLGVEDIINEVNRIMTYDEELGRYPGNK